MTDVAEELPFAAVVDDNQLDETCSNCFSHKAAIMGVQFALEICYRCGVVYYCNKECREKDWKFHKDECNFLIRLMDCPEYTVRILSRIIMRVRRGDLPVAFNGRTFKDLEEHEDRGQEWTGHYTNVYNALIRFMGEANLPPREEVISICRKYVKNRCGIIDSIDEVRLLGDAIYIGLSVHKHSCRPDCSTYFNGPKMVLRTGDSNAEYRTDLTMSYCRSLLPRTLRQEKLRRDFFVDCNCERCLDEEEVLWEQSGKSSCCTDGVILPRENGRSLVCSNCGEETSLTVEQINNANEQIARFCDRKMAISGNVTPKELDDYIQLFNNMERILSPLNLYLANMAEYIKIVHLRIYMDFAAVLRFLDAQEKAVDRYTSFGLGIVMFMLDKSLMEERALSQSRNGSTLMEKLVATLEKFCTVLNRCCGPECPLARQTEEKYNTWKRRLAMPLEFNNHEAYDDFDLD